MNAAAGLEMALMGYDLFFYSKNYFVLVRSFS